MLTCTVYLLSVSFSSVKPHREDKRLLGTSDAKVSSYNRYMYVGHTPVCRNLYLSYMCNVEVKVIFAAVKQHKHLQRKPRKK